MKEKLKFLPNLEPQGTSGFYYDLTHGGYIKPEKFLEPEDAKRVNDAIALLMQFESECEDTEVIYSL